jgi:uncharacterized RDD family membrane protein YckC
MSEQSLPPAEPTGQPAEASAPGAPQGTPPPVLPPPPVYTWQQPTEPAGPAPGVKFAGFGARLVAYIIDGFVVAVATVLVSLVLLIFVGVFAANGSGLAAGLTGLVWLVAIFVISIGYFPYFWVRDGQTPGMRMLRIRVVRDRDGGPVSGGQAVLRLIGYWVSGAVFYIGYIWVFVDSRRRGWHDLIAGTVVIEA